jgi:hypothetical protein
MLPLLSQRFFSINKKKVSREKEEGEIIFVGVSFILLF